MQHYTQRKYLKMKFMLIKITERAIQSETLANTKVCLRHRLGMSEKDFSKVKIAIVSETSYANPEYLDDDEMTLSNEGCLGLDHVDKSGCAESVFIRG
ncbi:unnamed protein product [Rhizophagus irregularis]|uniref:ubiquitinyl hydrolase 1 n=1 Tax=Rhizophagus irregularis TaxID=588596 RepID=A0A915Z5A0_9GLOM|nr:unnamed protein product [Rhizophagus irregularis]CAB5200517.1 unnamed protein product [Rhizophagus irregularis]CAB5363229.1 unnamed protein product [Rhizophagus irregularis]